MATWTVTGEWPACQQGWPQGKCKAWQRVSVGLGDKDGCGVSAGLSGEVGGGGAGVSIGIGVGDGHGASFGLSSRDSYKISAGLSGKVGSGVSARLYGGTGGGLGGGDGHRASAIIGCRASSGLDKNCDSPLVPPSIRHPSIFREIF